MTGKVGVFLCSCNGNISSKIEIAQLKERLDVHPAVAFVVEDVLACSRDGITRFSESVRNSDANRFVVAGCSPRVHKKTFQQALESTGRNPFLFQMANIREQCAYVTSDVNAATDKAYALTHAAVQRVLQHHPLQQKRVEAQRGVVVVGGGIAGIEAALSAAKDGRTVWLIEREPSIGGMMAQLEDIGPTGECASCLLAARIEEVTSVSNISVLTNSNVVALRGYLGSFTAKVHTRPRYVNIERCIACDDCINACPVERTVGFDAHFGTRKAIDVVFPGCSPYAAHVSPAHCLKLQGEHCDACVQACSMDALDFSQHGVDTEIDCGAIVWATGAGQFDPRESGQWLAHHPNVITHQAVARLLSNHGPTNGLLQTREGRIPHRMVFVHCVGRGSLGYCSGSCCTAAVQLGVTAGKSSQGLEIVHLVSDLMCQVETGEALLRQAKSQTIATPSMPPPGILGKIVSDTEHAPASMDVPPRFVRVDSIEDIRIESLQERLMIYFSKTARERYIVADMVCLVTGTISNEQHDSALYEHGGCKTEGGFISVDHQIMRASSSTVSGVYVAGTVAGPKGVQASIAQSHGAAAALIGELPQGRTIVLKAEIAQIDDDRCSRCGLCVAQCPYNAISRSSEGQRIEVNDMLCQECGVCAATCPAGAADIKGASHKQLDEEMKAVLK